MCDELRIEHGVSATAKRRPVFEALLQDLVPGDTLVLWALDRAFRSASAALNALNELQAKGVYVRVVSLGIDTSTPVGELFYTFLAGLAQFERRTLSERTKQGLEAARRRGAILGRPRKLEGHVVEEIRLTLSIRPNLALDDIADLYGCSRHTVSRALQRADGQS